MQKKSSAKRVIFEHSYIPKENLYNKDGKQIAYHFTGTKKGVNVTLNFNYIQVLKGALYMNIEGQGVYD